MLLGHHATLHLQGVRYESLLCCKFAGCLCHSLDRNEVYWMAFAAMKEAVSYSHMASLPHYHFAPEWCLQA